MEDIEFIEAKTEECPRFCQFRKYQIMGRHLDMAKLNYDPFPDAKMDDIVRTEIIGRKLVLYAKLRIRNPEINLHPGSPINYEGDEFIIEEIVQNDAHIIEIVGSKYLSSIEPIQVLQKLRDMLAASNPGCQQQSGGT